MLPQSKQAFLSTLSLRRATKPRYPWTPLSDISIHALLAESDVPGNVVLTNVLLFLSTLSLRRATRVGHCQCTISTYFYPRSPCGERPSPAIHGLRCLTFLSTLSLRRATALYNCDEDGKPISIHALLAESDLNANGYEFVTKQFLSTLSLRRATQRRFQLVKYKSISIHALLAESDIWLLTLRLPCQNFYPRSPCGERRVEWRNKPQVSADFYPRSPCGERRCCGP